MIRQSRHERRLEPAVGPGEGDGRKDRRRPAQGLRTEDLVSLLICPVAKISAIRKATHERRTLAGDRTSLPRGCHPAGERVRRGPLSNAASVPVALGIAEALEASVAWRGARTRQATPPPMSRRISAATPARHRRFELHLVEPGQKLAGRFRADVVFSWPVFEHVSQEYPGGRGPLSVPHARLSRIRPWWTNPGHTFDVRALASGDGAERRPAGQQSCRSRYVSAAKGIGLELLHDAEPAHGRCPSRTVPPSWFRVVAPASHRVRRPPPENFAPLPRGACSEPNRVWDGFEDADCVTVPTAWTSG